MLELNLLLHLKYMFVANLEKIECLTVQFVVRISRDNLHSISCRCKCNFKMVN